jgi:hypothetical protein
MLIENQKKKNQFCSSKGIDNGDENVGLSSKTLWRVKRRYISDNLNDPGKKVVTTELTSLDKFKIRNAKKRNRYRNNVKE